MAEWSSPSARCLCNCARVNMINLGAGIARWLLNGHGGLLTGCGGDIEAKGPTNMKPSVLPEPDLLGSWPRSRAEIAAAGGGRSRPRSLQSLLGAVGVLLRAGGDENGGATGGQDGIGEVVPPSRR